MSRSPDKDDQVSMIDRLVHAARDLVSEADPQATMQFAVDVAAENIDGCDAAALSLVSHGGASFETTAYTDEMALRGDLLQYEMRQGPCLDAIWHEPIVHSSDLAEEPRWPVWGRHVAEEWGARSMLCFRLFTNAGLVGALNLYSRTRGSFGLEDRDEGQALAAHIALAITASQHSEQMDQALDSRTVISQATGVLVERYGITPAVAFSVLTRVSSEAETKLREVAQHLMATGQLPGFDAASRDQDKNRRDLE